MYKKEVEGRMLLIDKKRILPFTIPKYSTYPKYTAILGILTAFNDEKAWLYNNFILLWAYIWVESREYWIDFKFGNEAIRKEFCPMIQEKKIKKGELNRDNLIETIQEKIQKNKYCFFLLDMYYIDEWWMKKKDRYHCTHQSLIYGYDCEKGVFYIVDFFKKKYKSIKVSYELLVEAYISGLSERSEMSEKYICDEELMYCSTEYTVNINLIRNQVEDFLFGIDTCRYNFLNLYQRGNVAYGMDFFRIIQTYLNDMCYNSHKLDIRPFRFIGEFNEIMVDRILYLKNQNGYRTYGVDKKFIEVAEINKIIVNLILKYNIQRNQEILYLIKSKFEQLIILEQNAIECLNEIFNKDRKTNTIYLYKIRL